MPLEFNKNNFEQEVINSEEKVLVDFWAEWCGPCRMLGPVIDKMSQERTDVKIGKINVDAEQELAQRYDVMTIPTVILFEAGKEVSRSVGLVSKEKLEEML